jgi:hypothetical protein
MITLNKIGSGVGVLAIVIGGFERESAVRTKEQSRRAR